MYLDSAYLAKFYVNEPDSPQIRELIESADDRVASEWSLVEVTCAFHRHFRQKELSARHYRELVGAFQKHIQDEVWTLVPVTGGLIRRSMAVLRSLPETVYLRAGDAIQLLCAQEAGESEIWSSDRHLLAAAEHFGLTGRSVR